ncbi:histidinol-phosphate transaminase [Thermosulfurimonas sp. F29]|uniref:pyridoxal phosphate-dependent aminotransferase n=1 Tax=Thermosulfurimonas sp. F29 TaxID=2867247 RepID=UPI001C8387B5|nr:threonine-phosphate decarboxylase [Thermosulfurimonas sp. F29]MBX6423876.1 pyridoxal phosphate-dependent class II aminotransferase [Thermosulfurimonas sp. F29]
MIRGHGGEIYHLARELGLAPEDILDFSSNVSPLPPPEGLYRVLSEHLREIEHLPEVDSFALRRALSERFGPPPEAFFPSSGTTEWIFALPEALGARRILILTPTYADYEDAARRAGKVPLFFPAREEEDFRPPLQELEAAASPGDLVFLCNPNNPTGAFLERESLLTLIRKHGETFFVVDESYLPFAAEDRESLLTASPFPENLVVLFSFSKIYRVPGLRLGFAAAGAALRKKLASRELPWAVNRLAQVAGEYLLRQKFHEERVRRFVSEERRHLAERLSGLGLRTFPSRANFLLVKLPPGTSAPLLRDRLLRQHHLLVRSCHNFRGLSEEYLRIALRTPEENERLLHGLARELPAFRDRY